MALYEVLIDDNEDIREIGVLIISQLVGKSLNPYAAAEELKQHRTATFILRSSSFNWKMA